MKYNIPPMEDLFSLECVHCMINQVINTTELANTPEEKRREIMQKALRYLADGDINRNNCIQIEAVYRIVTREIGIDDPYLETKRFFDRELMKILPDVRRHIAESADPLATAIRASIAGNLIDLALLGSSVTLDRAQDKVWQIDREPFAIDDVDALRAALAKAERVLVLADNCGEIALDRALVETIHDLYPNAHVQYGVRGRACANDATRDDAELVGMGEVAEVIDNGDGLLTTALPRTSPAFQDAFFGADVVICKGMGNFEGLRSCGRENVFFLMIAKCSPVAKMSGAPLGGIVCKKI